MPQEIEKITSTIRKLKINIPSNIIEEEIANAYSKLRASVKIPGFRAGRVPHAILEKKFSKDIEAEVIEKVIPEFYSKAIKEAQITPVSYPSINERIELVKNQPLSFTVTVEVKPRIENLTYEGIVLKEKSFSIEDNEVNTSMEFLQKERTLFSVSQGPIEDGDMAIIDYDVIVGENEVKELSAKGYPLVHSSQMMPKEVSDALLGKKNGDSIEVRIHFDDTHPNKLIAGKDVLFKITVTEVKKKFIPALDDEFAKGLGCKDIDELKKKIYDEIYNKKKKQINMEYKKELLNTLINSHDFEVPPSMLEREIEALVLKAKEYTIQRGEPLKGDEELRQEYKKMAIENIKSALVLEAIGMKQKIEVAEEDINKAINELAKEYSLMPEEVKKLYITSEGSLEGFKSRLYGDKVLDLILSKAIIKSDKVESSK